GVTNLYSPQKQMKPNYRRCISCRKLGPKEAFWRLVRLYPCHQVQLDMGMGRSAYLCPEAECLKAAQKKNRLGRSLKASVSNELYQTLWQRLATPSPASHKLSAEPFGQTPSRGSEELSAAPAPKPQSDPPTSLKRFVSD
ncbi:YlxR family protein, partial [Kamptonema sp. UHCC 0994]|uniref:YlxR family protein n=1 Tax=Kamptonema sp. UHCC 0994 TaxID=3031329 RepID=UPI0023B9A328